MFTVNVTLMWYRYSSFSNDAILDYCNTIGWSIFLLAYWALGIPLGIKLLTLTM
ncbi:hypothetical protein O9993_23450 [Vibrio lentus]|nr:hypothetical protein [Vibrio lentus]